MGTRCKYIRCVRCGELASSPVYYFESETLTEDEKDICYKCLSGDKAWLKKYNKRKINNNKQNASQKNKNM